MKAIKIKMENLSGVVNRPTSTGGGLTHSREYNIENALSNPQRLEKTQTPNPTTLPK